MPEPSREQLFRPTLHGPTNLNISPTGVTTAGAFAGRTTLGSGSATATVSTTAVKSGDIIMFALANAGAHVNVTSMGPICVKTISTGNFFTLGTISGAAPDPASAIDIMWQIYRPIG